MAGFLQKRFLILGLVTAAGLVLMAACSMGGSASDTAGPNAGFNPAAGGAGSNNNGASFDVASSTGGSSTPPEQKVTVVVEVPQASQNYVYAANPDRDSVAIINPVSLSIQTVSVESAPHGLKTIPNQDAAIVVNTGASSVSVLRTDSSGTKVATRAVMTGSNVVSIAPDGKHALVYFDSTQPTAGPPTDSPESMSALDLTQANPTAYQVTVGYHPTAVSYSSDSTKAFVVSDDGVSIVDLQHLNSAASRLSELVHLYDATVTSTASVSVTPDGANALAHQPRSTILRLVDLAAKDHVDLDLASFFAVSNSDAATPVPLDVSDVVMAPDGSFLLAVIRDRQTILRVPIPSGFDDASQVQRIVLPNVLTGAANIGPDEHYAVLYTTITTTNEQRISILDLTGQTALQTINLHKMVKGVAFDPTGKKAFILHVKSLGEPTQPNITQDQITARSFAYSVIDLASTASMLQLTLSDPGPIAALPDGSAMFILFPAAPWQVQRIELVGFAVDKISIGSQPTGIGFVNTANQVFVSQDQTDGRMTFIDWTNLQIRSVAGYELNSSIWE